MLYFKVKPELTEVVDILAVYSRPLCDQFHVSLTLTEVEITVWETVTDSQKDPMWDLTFWEPLQKFHMQFHI